MTNNRNMVNIIIRGKYLKTIDKTKVMLKLKEEVAYQKGQVEP